MDGSGGMETLGRNMQLCTVSSDLCLVVWELLGLSQRFHQKVGFETRFKGKEGDGVTKILWEIIPSGGGRKGGKGGDISTTTGSTNQPV